MCAFSILNGDSLMLMLELLQTFTFINIDAPFYAYPEKNLGLKKKQATQMKSTILKMVLGDP